MDSTVNNLALEYARKVHEAHNPKAVYLYGSYAKGTYGKYSDIDVAVVFESLDKEKYMDVFGNLWTIAAHVDGRIEPNLFIDDGEEDRFSMLYEIKKTGHIVNVN